MYQSKSVKAAIEYLGQVGIQEPQEFSEYDRCFNFPQNLAELSPDDLAEHLTVWTRYIDNISYYVAIANGNRTSLELAVDRLKAEKTLLIVDSFPDTKAAYLKAKLDTDSDLIDLRAKLQKATVTYEILSSRLRAAESKYAAVSRDLSRRGLCKS